MIKSFTQTELTDLLTRPINLSYTLNHILGMSLFTSLMVLGAFVRIHLPFTPVPITLQTLFVLLAGAYLGSGWGAGSMVLYLLLGVFGLPVFAGASFGLFFILGPTGGYLLGFVVGAWIVGKMIGSQSRPSWGRIFISFSIALFAIYFLGITQLILWTQCSLYNALLIGLIPFIPGALLKVILAASIIKKVKEIRP